MREPLPFPDASTDFIYSEHFFEHLSYPEEVGRLLSESLRVLQSGGLFSVGVPDTVWPIRQYIDGEQDYFEFSRSQGHIPNWCNTRMHVINYHFRWGTDHKYAYDLETLVKVLKQAGLVDVKQREFDPALDSEERRIGTLYVDAYKPE